MSNTPQEGMADKLGRLGRAVAGNPKAQTHAERALLRKGVKHTPMDLARLKAGHTEKDNMSAKISKLRRMRRNRRP